jgi:hypothetical protein
MASNILSIFNDQLVQFIDDIINVFPNNADILTAKNSILLAKKANPKLIIRIWKEYIVDKYRDQILAGDINFFINKDYSNDLQNNENYSKIISCIDRLRDPVKDMTDEDRNKTMKYIQNLTKLIDIYYK